MPKSKQYHREYSKKDYKEDKALRVRYHTMESHPTETFSEFKKRMKKEESEFTH